MPLFSPCLGGGVTNADLPSYYSNGKEEFCEKRFNMVIHYHYYNCLHTEETPWSLPPSLLPGGAGLLQHTTQRAGRKSEDPATLTLSSLRASSHSGARP